MNADGSRGGAAEHVGFASCVCVLMLLRRRRTWREYRDGRVVVVWKRRVRDGTYYVVCTMDAHGAHRHTGRGELERMGKCITELDAGVYVRKCVALMHTYE